MIVSAHTKHTLELAHLRLSLVTTRSLEPIRCSPSPNMSSPLRSETAFPKQSPSRGVWGFMKRKVWGDVASHPISDTESETQREASPEGSDVATGSSPDLSTPKSPTEPRPHSPFQSHVSAQPEDESNEEARPDLQAGRGPAGNTASMASEPSLRHGLGKGMQCTVSNILIYISRASPTVLIGTVLIRLTLILSYRHSRTTLGTN